MLVGSPCSTTLKATQRPGEITKPIPYSQRGGLGGKSLLQIGDPGSAKLPFSPACTVSRWPLVSLGPAYLFSPFQKAASCPGQGDPKGASVLRSPHNNSSHQGTHELSASPSLIPAPQTIISISS